MDHRPPCPCAASAHIAHHACPIKPSSSILMPPGSLDYIVLDSIHLAPPSVPQIVIHVC
jgi:hypothetical protein